MRTSLPILLLSLVLLPPGIAADPSAAATGSSAAAREGGPRSLSLRSGRILRWTVDDLLTPGEDTLMDNPPGRIDSLELPDAGQRLLDATYGEGIRFPRDRSLLEGLISDRGFRFESGLPNVDYVIGISRASGGEPQGIASRPQHRARMRTLLFSLMAMGL